MPSDPDPLIAARRSPRTFDPDFDLPVEVLRRLLEAARWAPSYGNTQPARFLVGLRGTASFGKLFDALNSGNQRWTHRASALLIGVAMTSNAKGALPFAEYGVGLAVENLVLQAVAEELVAHQMAGFSADAVRTSFGVPAEARPLVAIAVGALGTVDQLPEDLQARELLPRKRLPLTELAFTDTWGNHFL
jgi:nitroreductase